jgi:hypothetical protein
MSDKPWTLDISSPLLRVGVRTVTLAPLARSFAAVEPMVNPGSRIAAQGEAALVRFTEGVPPFASSGSTAE